MAKPYLSLQEPHISTPYSHYTSLFNSARFHSDRCDVKSLCKLWCYFSVKSLEILFVRRHSFQERQPTPNHNLNKVCIQNIFQLFLALTELSQGKFPFWLGLWMKSLALNWSAKQGKRGSWYEKLTLEISTVHFPHKISDAKTMYWQTL